MEDHEPNTATRLAMAELDAGLGQRCESIWDVLEDTPEEAQRMRLLSTLLQALTRRVTQWDCYDVVAAERLGITLDQLGQLRAGKIQHFSLDGLVAMCARAGLRVELTVTEDTGRPPTAFERMIDDETYRSAIAEVSDLFDMDPEPDPRSEVGRRFDAMISVIEAYEALHFGVGGAKQGAGDDEAELPEVLLHAPRYHLQWFEWRDRAVEDLSFSTRLLTAAARRQLYRSHPGAWKDLVVICQDALRVAGARRDAGGSDALAALLETMRSLHEIGAVNHADSSSEEGRGTQSV